MKYKPLRNSTSKPKKSGKRKISIEKSAKKGLNSTASAA